MDPALRREKEAFKKRAIANTEKTKKNKEAAAKAKASVRPIPSKKAKKPVQAPGKPCLGSGGGGWYTDLRE